MAHSIKLQVQSIILPTISPLGTETETIDDLVEHTSLEFPIDYIQEKNVQIIATEVTALGVSGPLWAWVELSPVASTTSTAYWAAIGGGGGDIVPTTPTIVPATGVSLTVHTFMLQWTTHSPFARVVIQTPVAAALPLAVWLVQVVVGGKSP